MRRNGVLYGVQYLRCIAALLVVMHHAWQMIPLIGAGDLGFMFNGGGAGVDVFFVISGFIMVYITAGREVPWNRFILDRAARIAPPYWIATLVVAVFLILAPGAFKSMKFDLAGLFMSFLFIPYLSTSGIGIVPLLQVGWTLNFEMFFYVLFALSLAGLRSTQARVVAVSAVIAVLSLFRFLVPLHGAIPMFYTCSIMLEFIFGMVLALMVPHLPSSRIAALVFLIVAAAIFARALTFAVGMQQEDRVLTWGIPAALLVAGVVWCDCIGLVFRSRFLLFLGNSSYALYLLHLLPLGLIRKVWPHVTAHVHLSDAVLLVVSAVLCFSVAAAFHVLVELPLHRLSRRVLDAGKRPRIAPVPSPLDLEDGPMTASPARS